MALHDLVIDLKSYAGLRTKRLVGEWARDLGNINESCGAYGPGDDTGAVEMQGGYLLLSGEALQTALFDDPWLAGFCSVTVNVNDVYAMGGRPLGLTAVVFSGGFSAAGRKKFLEGMGSGLEHYELPLVGGHTSAEGNAPLVAVSIAGFAKTLMKGSCAAPGDRLVVAQDLQGKRYGRLHIWDTVTSAEGAHTRAMLEPLPAIAESGLCSACRDVSNAGLLGTVAMMMEASGTGAEVDLDSLAVPIGVGLQWWLKAYPSYGFILSVPPENLEAVTGMFEGVGATCSLIGEVTEGSSVMLSLSDETDIFLDWKSEPVTGLF